VNVWLAFLLISLASARLTRLVCLDVLFDEPRNWIVGGLQDPVQVKTRERDGFRFRPLAEPEYHSRGKVAYWLRNKLGYMIQCAYCASAYCTALVLFGFRIFVEPVPAPVLWWLAAWMVAVVVLEITDGE